MQTQKKYKTSSLRKLKEEAVVARDIDTLLRIREFETSVRQYFRVIGEDVLRDKDGQIITPDDSIFLLIGGYRSADGRLVQPVPGELWERIMRAESSVIVHEVEDLEKLGELSIDRPVRVSNEEKRLGEVKWYQAGPSLTFVSVESLTPDQLAEYIEIHNNLVSDED